MVDVNLYAHLGLGCYLPVFAQWESTGVSTGFPVSSTIAFTSHVYPENTAGKGT